MDERRELLRLVTAVVVVLVTGATLFSYLESLPWIDSLYFITVSLSSFGDITPTSPWSRVLLVTFVLCFMGLFSVVVHEMSLFRHKWLEQQLLRRSVLFRRVPPQLQEVVLAALIFLHTVVTGASVLMLTEGWTFGDGLYFSCITLTTLGYGDLLVTNSVSKLFVAALALYGLAVTGFVVSVIGDGIRAVARRPFLLTPTSPRKSGQSTTTGDKHA